MSKPSLTYLTSLVWLSLVVTACSSSDSTGGDSSGDEGSCKSYAPCEMVGQADVSTAIGGPVAAGTESDMSSGAVELKRCDWDSDAMPHAERADLLLRCYSKGDNDPAGAKKTLQGLYTNVVDVSDVGDSAVWGSGVIGSSMSTIDGQLDVFVGKSIYFIVGVGKMPDDATALAAAKKIAADVLPKL